MFVGHFAMGFAAKRAAPRVSLATLFLACMLLDFIWPVLVIAGIEIVKIDPSGQYAVPLNLLYMPFSHGLVMTLIWSALMGAILGIRHRSALTGLVVGAVVFSHWLLDFITHRPDLPLLFNGTKFGLGLWRSFIGTLVVEGALFGLGVFLYSRTTQAKTRRGSVLFITLVAFLFLAYVIFMFGPAPPLNTPGALIAGPALSMWLIVLWGYYVDRNRTFVY